MLKEKSIAIVIHAFYLDLLPEILENLRSLDRKTFVLYVTTTKENLVDVNEQLKEMACFYHLIEVGNRGRDVLPFVKILPMLIQNKHEVVIKLHTKKSPHLKNGGSWRTALYEGLIGKTVLLDNIRRLTQDPNLGLWAPPEYMFLMSKHWGCNKARVVEASKLLGLDLASLDQLYFPAGTMFLAKVDALKPILRLSLKDEDFEEEKGQLDGTFAHVLERVIGVSVVQAGFALQVDVAPTAFLTNVIHFQSAFFQRALFAYKTGGASLLFKKIIEKITS